MVFLKLPDVLYWQPASLYHLGFGSLALVSSVWEGGNKKGKRGEKGLKWSKFLLMWRTVQLWSVVATAKTHNLNGPWSMSHIGYFSREKFLQLGTFGCLSRWVPGGLTSCFTSSNSSACFQLACWEAVTLLC